MPVRAEASDQPVVAVDCNGADLGPAEVAAGAAMILRIALPDRAPAKVATHLWAEVVEGCRWTLHHAGVRTLVLTIFIFNITFGAAWSVLVLYAEERLHLGAVGFGLLTTAMAFRNEDWQANGAVCT